MVPYPLLPTAGTISPDQIAGREHEIERLIQLLRAQSVVIDEFRRMGKTLLLQKFEYLGNKKDLGNKAIYFTVQNTQQVTEFTDTLLDTLRSEQNHSWLKIGYNKLKKLYNNVKPEEVQFGEITFKLPEFTTRWKDSLTACIEDIADREHKKGELLTLILDEFPMMLWNWIQNNRAQEAIELLDTLRTIRHNLKEKGNIRFVICGSIGLGIVLRHLKEKFKYTGEAFNDAENFSVEAMTEADALFLCECLYLSGFTHTGDKEILFRAICTHTERLPFYINKIFSIISTTYGRNISAANIEKAYNDILTNPQYGDVFDQLHTRLDTYYGESAPMMQGILNELSEKEQAVDEREITAIPEADKQKIKWALERLVKEQYLLRTFTNEKRHYQFKYQLFKKWWKLNKA